MADERMHRAAGVLLGQACGDALGVPYEFSPRLPANAVPQMSGGGLGPYASGEWSDDTQMAVCIAEISATGMDLAGEDALDAIAERFEHWAASGATDIGSQTRAVMDAAREQQGRPSVRLHDAAADLHRRTGRTAGNGALMRTSVVGLAALDDRDRTAAAARAVAELTHADLDAGDSCVLWSEAVRLAVTDGRFDLVGGLDLLPARRRDRWAALIAEADGRAPWRFSPNGWTATALQAAWAAVTSTSTPELQPGTAVFPCLHLQHALHAAVRAGDDTDTVAAIAGGLLGARWGTSAVPWSWRRSVHGWPGLRARDLIRLAVLTATGGRDLAQGWPSVSRMPYDEPPRPEVAFREDHNLWLGAAHATGHDADAVVSLCRMGRDEVPAPGVRPEDHAEVWLVDSDDPADNPNLHFVLADTVQAIAILRFDDKRRVLLHSVRAEHRTPVVAALTALENDCPLDEAVAAVRQALPQARLSGPLWDAGLQLPYIKNTEAFVQFLRHRMEEAQGQVGIPLSVALFDMSRLAHAASLAAELHASQARKGTTIPYLSHLLAVCALVMEDGGDTNEAVAALLHDAVEDQGGAATLERIRVRFGDEVTRIVDACSDAAPPPGAAKAPWQQRKEAHLRRLTEADEAVLRVTAADKLHNARATLVDLQLEGQQVWERFRTGRDGFLWYHRAVLDLLERRLPESRSTRQLHEVVERLEATP